MSEGKSSKATSHCSESNGAKSPAILLDGFSPIADFDELTGGSSTGKIMKAQQDDLFAPVSPPKVLACVIHRVLDDRGWLVAEKYCLVPQHLQGLLPVGPRKLAFHPCVAESGKHFIFPRKIDSLGYKPNSWNQSLDEALQKVGQWRRIWPDNQAERYHYEFAKGPDGVLLEYPGFEDDLAASLSSNIIDRLDHPILEAILAERQRAMEQQKAKSDREVY
tara:strand:+ start:1790 stop:2449 length:660 start_codon:yes stop_codon:yes gene_type:complete